ncbi:MAG: Sigma factor RpoE negative regulatory protein RseA [Burkholderiaceae bacterium]|jgi:sigma-E factor negative regulatory protein RseA|nr:MAG: Sigma factor RpoE negative regulatory protein RseA [Burkholderiaceae bacterium]
MNMDETPHPHEAVSALADGQLRGEAFARTVEFVASDAHARARWHAYHLVGDVLRSAELAVCRTDTHFIARLRERLQQEQPPARPGLRESVALGARKSGARSAEDLPRAAANDANMRWKLVAGVATLVAVLALVWHGTGLQSTRPQPPQLAQATPAGPQGGTVPATGQGPATTAAVALAGNGEAPAMIRDPQLDALLVAHEQLGRSTVLQMHAGFLRNAAFGDEPR